MRNRHAAIPETGAWLRRVVQGYLNYHAVPGNSKRLGMFRAEVCRAWRRALRRRSQRSRMTWERFKRLAERYIPKVRTIHPTPTSASRHDSRQEPYAVIPPVRICAGGGWQQPSLPRPSIPTVAGPSPSVHNRPRAPSQSRASSSATGNSSNSQPGATISSSASRSPSLAKSSTSPTRTRASRA